MRRAAFTSAAVTAFFVSAQLRKYWGNSGDMVTKTVPSRRPNVQSIASDISVDCVPKTMRSTLNAFPFVTNWSKHHLLVKNTYTGTVVRFTVGQSSYRPIFV